MRSWLATIMVLGVVGGGMTVGPVNATEGGTRYLLRTTTAIDTVAARHGLTVLGGTTVGGTLWVVESPTGFDPTNLANDSQIISFEAAQVAALPERDGLGVLHPYEQDTIGGLAEVGTATTACLHDAQWAGWVVQPATLQIDLAAAHAASVDCGAGVVVAVIDTGVDPRQPVLAGALVAGFDFLTGTATANEYDALDQSVMAIVEDDLVTAAGGSETTVRAGGGVGVDAGTTEQSVMAIVEQSVMAIVEQSVMAIVEEEQAASFGHGTMVAGLVRLAAPEAKIMPLRVFRGDGTAQLHHVVRAIYYAVDHGADVINMSFSFPSFSTELRAAIDYARQNGVVTVAAAGNRGAREMVYPAALPGTLGVGASNDDGTLAEFSNLGPGSVEITAPGVGVVSTYPGGLWAAGWGTSFSTPLVAGAAALIFNQIPGRTVSAADERARRLTETADEIATLEGTVRHGCLDAAAALAP